MTKKLIQNPLISRQLLPLRAKLRVEPPQGHQGLVPDDVVQCATGRPRRTGRPLVGMVSRRDDLQERLDSLLKKENNRTYLLRSQVCAQTVTARFQRLPFGPSHFVTVVGHEFSRVDQTSWKSHLK